MDSKFNDKTHLYGRIWIVLTLLVFIGVPLAICMHFDVWPKASVVFTALVPLMIVYWPTAILEVIAYSPLLGTGGTYVGFVTGNVTNLKVPVALNSMEKADVKPNTEEGEAISTIAIATSSIVTAVIIAVCVLAFRPVLEFISADGSPVAPAFTHINAALFGSLCATYLSKNWKIAIIPTVILVIVLIFSGGMGVGTLIPIGIVVALLGAFLLYKKGWL